MIRIRTLSIIDPDLHILVVRGINIFFFVKQIPLVQCPASSLVLKCAILHQAANLASATKTTVRIPINVATEDKSFGVYAVPGLNTHVFVGPFTIQKKLQGCIQLPST